MTCLEGYSFKKLTLPVPRATVASKRSVDLSIIMPVYNVEQFVRAAIESVITQVTEFSFELIIVDDASTDHSREVVNEFIGHDCVKFIKLDSNRGLGGARNVGIDNASGKFLTFIDSDDAMLPGAIDYWLNTACEYDSDLVSATHLSFQDDAELNGSKNFTGSVSLLDKNKDYRQVAGFAWGKIFHYSLFEGIRFPERVAFEDIIIIPLLIDCARKCVLSNRVVIAYRWRPNSLSRRESIVRGDSGLDHFEGLLYAVRNRKPTSTITEIYRSYMIDQVGSAFKSRSFYMERSRLSQFLKLFYETLQSEGVAGQGFVETQIIKSLNGGCVSRWRLLCKWKRWFDKRALSSR